MTGRAERRLQFAMDLQRNRRTHARSQAQRARVRVHAERRAGAQAREQFDLVVVQHDQRAHRGSRAVGLGAGRLIGDLNAGDMLDSQTCGHGESVAVIDLEPIRTCGVQVHMDRLTALVLDTPVDLHRRPLQGLYLSRNGCHQNVVILNGTGPPGLAVDPDGQRLALGLPVLAVDLHPLPALIVGMLLKDAHIRPVPVVPLEKGTRQRHLQRPGDKVLHPDRRIRSPKVPGLFVGRHRLEVGRPGAQRLVDPPLLHGTLDGRLQ